MYCKNYLMVKKKKNGKNTYMATTVSVHPFTTIGSTTVAWYLVLIIFNIKLVVVCKLKSQKIETS